MLLNVEIPLIPAYLVDYDDVLGIDIDQAAADVAVFVIPFKCEISMVGLAISEAMAGTTPGQVDFDIRPTIGSDTLRTAATAGHLMTGTAAIGKLLYDIVGKGTVLYPGQEVVVQIAVRPLTGATGHFRPVLVVKPIPEEFTNLTGMVETA